MTESHRPEARALELSQLNRYQLRAVRKIAALLQSSTEELDRYVKEERNKPDIDSRAGLDSFRSSRIFFLSGEPGTGKTTVYLSLRKAMQDSKVDTTDKDLTKVLGNIHQRIILLEPLDLEPAAGSTNFLAAVLARIEAKLEGLGLSDARGTQPRRPGILEPPGSQDALMEFQRLKGDIGLAWDGNLPQRAAQVDPDTFSVEVLRAEHARLSMNDKIRKTLDGLAKRMPGDNNSERIFLLPIDDFYLRPASSLELLRLLRMISAPRLFFLVLGDFDVVEELFYQDMLGQLIKLAGQTAFKKIDRQQEILTSRARSLASTALRKLIPPNQRERLEAMDWQRALYFLPVNSSSGTQALGSLLSKLPLDLSLLPRKSEHSEVDRPSDLLAFLFPAELKEVLSTEPLKEVDSSTCYSGCQILEAPPRHAHDFWSAIDATGKGDHASTLRLIANEALQAFHEQIT